MVREQIKGTLAGFIDFIRDRGVAGFAIGFILGGAAQKLVQALMDDIMNPLIGFFFNTENLTQYTVGAFKIGDFISALINFFILALVVYVAFKLLQLEKLDRPKV
ncbi:MscL family protein [Candidatus Kaiserbacteria bacterium]|nr:MscL family protein [Candidatus Kaiserbacteria bacterium]